MGLIFYKICVIIDAIKSIEVRTLLEEGRLLKADKILSKIWDYAEEEKKAHFKKDSPTKLSIFIISHIWQSIL